LVHFGNYVTNVFPSPSYETTHGTNLPTAVHLHIEKEINRFNRPKLNISPDAVFDEKTFVFLGSNDWDQGRSFMKDIDDPSLWSKDEESSKFYKSFLRYRAGDEVLQVGYLDLKIIWVAMDKEGFSSGKDNLVSKMGGRDWRIIEIAEADVLERMERSNEGVAIMMIHDLFGWTFSNTRILADYYAEEVGATVLVPDFFGGEILPAETILDDSRWAELDLPAFLTRNSKSVRGPEIIKTAEALRASYRRFGVMGFCFGGWGAFHIGAKDKQLADCISVAHPTMVEKTEIDALAVPVQIMAPEMDPIFTEELKEYSNQVIPKLGIPYSYQYFPGLEHGFAIRGNPNKLGERRGMERAKNAAVYWFREWLLENE
ncbi:dienelactone hydrolase family-domain-containing protein, partial [Fusarium oxysporum]